jgi:hypothetical protein
MGSQRRSLLLPRLFPDHFAFPEFRGPGGPCEVSKVVMLCLIRLESSTVPVGDISMS